MKPLDETTPAQWQAIWQRLLKRWAADDAALAKDGKREGE